MKKMNLPYDYQNHPPHQVVFYEDNFENYDWIGLEDDFLENDLVFQDYHYDDYNYDAEKIPSAVTPREV